MPGVWWNGVFMVVLVVLVVDMLVVVGDRGVGVVVFVAFGQV